MKDKDIDPLQKKLNKRFEDRDKRNRKREAKFNKEGYNPNRIRRRDAGESAANMIRSERF